MPIKSWVWNKFYVAFNGSTNFFEFSPLSRVKLLSDSKFLHSEKYTNENSIVLIIRLYENIEQWFYLIKQHNIRKYTNYTVSLH